MTEIPFFVTHSDQLLGELNSRFGPAANSEADREEVPIWEGARLNIMQTDLEFAEFQKDFNWLFISEESWRADGADLLCAFSRFDVGVTLYWPRAVRLGEYHTSKARQKQLAQFPARRARVRALVNRTLFVEMLRMTRRYDSVIDSLVLQMVSGDIHLAQLAKPSIERSTRFSESQAARASKKAKLTPEQWELVLNRRDVLIAGGNSCANASKLVSRALIQGRVEGVPEMTDPPRPETIRAKVRQ